MGGDILLDKDKHVHNPSSKYPVYLVMKRADQGVNFDKVTSFTIRRCLETIGGKGGVLKAKKLRDGNMLIQC